MVRREVLPVAASSQSGNTSSIQKPTAEIPLPPGKNSTRRTAPIGGSVSSEPIACTRADENATGSASIETPTNEGRTTNDSHERAGGPARKP